MNQQPIDGLILSDDLMDSSKVTTTARSLGFTIRQIRSIEQLQQQAAAGSIQCLILDLHYPGLDLDGLMKQLKSDRPAIRVIGYGSHVDAGRLKSARQSGIDPVMPRSQFFESIQSHLQQWMIRPDESVDSSQIPNGIKE